jgi:hypothetical protein
MSPDSGNGGSKYSPELLKAQAELERKRKALGISSPPAPVAEPEAQGNSADPGGEQARAPQVRAKLPACIQLLGCWFCEKPLPPGPFKGICRNCKTEYDFPARYYTGCKEKYRTAPDLKPAPVLPSPAHVQESIIPQTERLKAPKLSEENPGSSVDMPKFYKDKFKSKRHFIDFHHIEEVIIRRKESLKIRLGLWHLIRSGEDFGKPIPVFTNPLKPGQRPHGNDYLVEYLRRIGWRDAIPCDKNELEKALIQFWEDRLKGKKVSAMSRLVKSKKYSILRPETILVEDSSPEGGQN